MPKVMYINSTGTNPTGIIIPLERRKEIYKLACEYNFLIIDDDPYHFLHYEKVSLSFICEKKYRQTCCSIYVSCKVNELKPKR